MNIEDLKYKFVMWRDKSGSLAVHEGYQQALSYIIGEINVMIYEMDPELWNYNSRYLKEKKGNKYETTRYND